MIKDVELSRERQLRRVRLRTGLVDGPAVQLAGANGFFASGVWLSDEPGMIQNIIASWRAAAFTLR
jgi:hypothetical protein